MLCILLDGSAVSSLYTVERAEDCPEQLWEHEGSVLYRTSIAQPSDVSSSDSLPPAEDLGAAWGAAFVLVVGCYAIGRGVGAVLSLLK